MKSRSLFIGYRSSDAAKVARIARDLTLLRHDDGTPRYTTWQDKHNLPPASPNWWNAIVDAIEKCEVFVFHLSRTSLTSEVCLAELEYAHKRNRPIIPVVLDGEFFLNTVSGKYDLPGETWKLVPEWLRDAQMLFYVETDFYRLFQDALAVFERNWPRDIPAPRPPNPGETGSSHARYRAACDYAEQLAFTEAEKHFDVLVRRNDEDYADVALQWMNVIRLYAELIEIVEHRNPPVIFNRRWAEYTKLFPNDFVEGVFDPRGFAARAAPPASPPPARLSSSMVPALLPAPFAWVEIPGGRGTMATDDRNVTLSIPSQTYWMAKYPVTNAQYAKFVEAGGYSTQRWWTAQGWQTCLTEAWTQPRNWTHRKWKGPEQPVVGVSWYEAVAFCLWLSEMTGEKIMLPTEAQWQYAAQGDDGRAYPWGNEWDAGRCNNNVDGKGIGRTTPVRQYEGKGDSPFGVVDMAGNVDEWCLTLSETGRDDLYGTDRRVLRGGSYGPTHAANFRCAFRSWFYPNGTNVGWGIRLALTPSAQVIGHDSAQIVTHTVAAMPKPAPPPPPPARLSSSMVPALLPAPFAWVEIPGGRGTMATYKSDVTLSIPSQTYWMAKYPVTNVQYAVFIEAGGYTTERWWTAEGWQKRKAEKWTQPRYWTDSNWNGAEQPVVGVSWYEAVAFCRWLSETTGEKIMLPTEAQWQYAAQGDDGRAYPWGNPWDAGRCNNNVDGKGLVPHHYDIYG